MRTSRIKHLALASFLMIYALSIGKTWAENQNKVSIPELAAATSSPATFFRGDVNLDGKVSVSDMVSLVTHLNGKNTLVYNKQTADADGNGIVDQQDVTLLLHWILSDTHGESITITEDTDNTTGTTPGMPWG